MAKNRFEQVDEAQTDAITLVLQRQDDADTGTVIFPASASGGRRSADHVSTPLPAKDAFRGAIKLANDMKVALVICDPHTVWNPEWGELYRPVQ